MTEKFFRDSSFAFTIDLEDTWNEQTLNKCRKLFEDLDWNLGESMPQELMPILLEVVGHKEFEGRLITDMEYKKVLANSMVNLLVGIGKGIKNKTIGQHDADPPAKSNIDVLEELLRLKRQKT